MCFPNHDMTKMLNLRRRALLRAASGLLVGALPWGAVAIAAGLPRLQPLDGAQAPRLEDGGVDALASVSGRPVVLNFWASWCAPCVEEMPQLMALAGRRPDVAVLTVAVADSAAAVARFRDDWLMDLPVVLDPDQRISRAWGVRMLPTTIVLDHAHRRRHVVRGAADWSHPGLDPTFDRLLESSAGGQP